MARNHPNIPFERYAEIDAICHCRSEKEARTLWAWLEKRFAQCGLMLHPDKTKVVYCKDDDRRGEYLDHRFDFLGYTFRPRLSRRWKGFGVSFNPQPAAKLSSRSGKLSATGRSINAATRRWMILLGCSTVTSAAGSTTTAVTTSRLSIPPCATSTKSWRRWAHRKFKSLRRHKRRTHHWLANVIRRQPDLFVHWRLLYGRGRTMGAG